MKCLVWDWIAHLSTSTSMSMCVCARMYEHTRVDAGAGLSCIEQRWMMVLRSEPRRTARDDDGEILATSNSAG